MGKKNNIVERKKIVTIQYTLKDEHENVLETDKTLTYLHGFKNIPIGLEEALEGKTVGDTLSVAVPPEKAYGDRNENMVFTLPKGNFQNDNSEIKVGMEFETVVDDVPYILTVIEVSEESITVDANHPLTGKALFFDVKITDMREAYSDELVQGFPISKENDVRPTEKK